MLRLLKTVTDAALSALPESGRRRALAFLLSRQAPESRLQGGTLDMWASLENLPRNGFLPGMIVDGGAFDGEWARRVRPIFPSSFVLMLEANPSKETTLRTTASQIGNAHHRIALLGPEPRRGVDFHLMESGSSVLSENTSFPRTTLTLPMTTLDSVVIDPAAHAPLFVKLDVQGFEIEVLKGGLKTLAYTEVVLLEVALLPYNKGAPLLAEVVAFMKAAGFVAYDICGQLRRQSDNAMFQLDIAFVREGSSLRSHKPFWERETSAL